MIVQLSGLNESSSELRIKTPQRIDWHAVSAMLSIEGVRFYYVQPFMIGVHYDKSVSGFDINKTTAQAMRVVASVLRIEPKDLAVMVYDRKLDTSTQTMLADTIWRLAQKVSTPAFVPANKILPRGTGPAYWPKPQS